MDDGVEVAWERRTDTFASLRVSGRLMPGWCGYLATGLAKRGIGIASGHAVIVEAGSWRADFSLHCARAVDPSVEEISLLLDADPGAGFTSPIVLLDFRLGTSESRGGCLALEIEGADRIGFLAALLRRLAYHSLFPVELRLETFGERVYDRLWLRGGFGSAPLPRAEKALAASLDALVRNDEGSADLERDRRTPSLPSSASDDASSSAPDGPGFSASDDPSGSGSRRTR